MIELWNALPVVIQILIKIIAIVLPLLGMVAYYTLAERKVIGYIQVRIGPNRVGWRGSLQPIADAVKLMMKEIVIPTKADKVLFLLAPMIAIAPAWPPGRCSPSTKGWCCPTSMPACSICLR